MLRILLALLVGLVGAAVVHIAVIFAIPRVAEDNAWGRLSRIAPLFEPVAVPALQPEADRRSGFAFVDPLFVTYACRFDTGDGPVRLSAVGETRFWSASIYTRGGDNIYSTNRRVAPDGAFDLLVATAVELEAIRLDSGFPGDNTVPVAAPAGEFYLTIRAAVDDESERPQVEAFMSAIACEAPTPVAGSLPTAG